MKPSSNWRGKKLKKGAIQSKQLRDGGVAAADIAPGVIPAITPQARTFHNANDITVGDLASDDFVTVATLSGLPAGDYFLSGKAEANPDPLGGSDTAQVVCALFVNGNELDRSRLQLGENAAPEPVVLRGTIPVETATAVPAGGEVTMACQKGGSNISVDASNRSLTAIAVDLP